MHNDAVRIQRLQLEHFRSYRRLDCDFAESDIHLLIGPNGAGKTNMLEAMHLLSEGESCLGRPEEELVTWGETYYRVRGSLESDDGERMDLEIVSERSPRTRRAFFVKDIRTPSSAFLGTLPSILFLPQDLDLFSGAPQPRRRLLDRTLKQVFPEFRSTADIYQKALKQRGALLRRIADGTGRREDLRTWDAILAREGATITERRLELLGVLQCTLVEELRHLGEEWATAVFSYQRTGTALTREEIERELLQEFERTADRDVLLQATRTGPHRDDWSMVVESRSLPSFASRGEQRTAILALLFLLGSYVELQRGERPVILLDDVFSELDESHQEALLTSFEQHQVFITATHLPPSLDATVWEVHDGTMKEQIATSR